MVGSLGLWVQASPRFTGGEKFIEALGNGGLIPTVLEGDLSRQGKARALPSTRQSPRACGNPMISI